MADNALRQLGEPRINIFADRQRPEPLHLEINNWEHAVNLLYQECVRRNLVDELIIKLKTKIDDGGCGLKSVSDNIKEHFRSEKTRFNVLSNRLIGAQAIRMAKFGLRVVDILKCESESDMQKFKRVSISNIFETLTRAW